MVNAMSAAKLAWILSGILVCLAGAFLLHLSQTPAETTETFTTTLWSLEAGPVFDTSLWIPSGERRSLVLQRSEPIRRGDWVQVGFTITGGVLDVAIQDYDGETVRDLSDASGRVKIAFFAPRESLYFLVLTNSKSNMTTTFLDFQEVIYRLSRSSLSRRIETAPRQLPVAASYVIIALGVVTAAYGFKQARKNRPQLAASSLNSQSFVRSPPRIEAVADRVLPGLDRLIVLFPVRQCMSVLKHPSRLASSQ